MSRMTRRGMFGFLAGAAVAIPAANMASSVSVAAPSVSQAAEVSGLLFLEDGDLIHDGGVVEVSSDGGLIWRSNYWQEIIREVNGIGEGQ